MIAYQPRWTTTHSSQTNGTNAMTNEVTKSIAAMLFLIRRLMLIGTIAGALTGRSRVGALMS
jgi:hypothetical protein